jgi:hypothetical protein
MVHFLLVRIHESKSQLTSIRASMDHLKKSYKKNQDVVFRRVSDESILVPIKDNVGDLGFIYNLNDVGTFIWERIDGKKQLMDIKKMLVNEFDVSPSQAEKDLLEFIAHLEKMSIIEAKRSVS